MPASALIINADDLGLHPAVDRGIVDAWALGAISDSSVFANTPHLAELLQHADAIGMPVGVHLNLTLGPPLSNPSDIPTLVSAEGAFMKRTMWTMPLPIHEVYLELERQVERVCELGWRPSHLDSHHHIHRYPEILDVVMTLAHSYQLPVRATDSTMREALRAEDIMTPGHLSMEFYGEAATVETLMRLVEGDTGGVLEIMTHPGHTSPDVPSSYGDERARELRALTDPAWLEWLEDLNIPLIGYGNLR